jgi:hypothetical protein
LENGYSISADPDDFFKPNERKTFAYPMRIGREPTAAAITNSVWTGI